MKEFNMPNNNSVQEESINSESEIIPDAFNEDEGKIENDYDQPVSQEEISGFREKIEKIIEKNKEEDKKNV
ncbi:hypothetical protein GQ568_00420 [Patescibacteria group bacterium]|nr:hypothetical protein [Patescibacteria group bacterium]